MSTILNPYLSFSDNAREAMEFYHGIFGGTLDVSTFADFQMMDDPADADKVMHAMLTGDGGLVLMGADTPASMTLVRGTDHSVSLSGEDEGQLRGYWNRLAVGGTVTMELTQAPWGDSFGMLTDRFGISWMVNINGADQGGAAQYGGNPVTF